MTTLTARHGAPPPVQGDEDWISVSDLMSALMMIFLLLAVFYMMFLDERSRLQMISEQEGSNKTLELESQLSTAEASLADQSRLLMEAEQEKAEKERLLREASNQMALLKNENELKLSKFDAVISEAVIYEDVIKELRQSLLGEFNADLNRWNAELRDDLTFRFNEPRTLFTIGDATLRPRFKRILDDFFPRYIKVITSEKFRNDIAEVRIEGHTSSVWGDLPPYGQQAYFNNMELSQKRSRNTLYYVTRLPEAEPYAEWLKSRLTANGLSSSKLVDKNGFFLDDPRSDGVESLRHSQRAEFRVRIDAESKITKILDSGKIE